ncbi:PDZ domain-containing protein [Gallaecimonas pentaromativorans]|uniref:PDZ domain-containing protein n=1 Tax=Gallaecimonas pentaromativorans TaxID=584787 RepID=UPI003A91AAE8
MRALWLLGLLALTSLPTLAADNDAEQLARERTRAAVMAAESDGNIKHQVLEEPARRFYDWGAVMNKDFEVVAVTPGSDAAQMGIQKGDKVLSVNGKLTNRRELKDVLAQLNDLENGAALSVQVQRGKEKSSFSTEVHVKVIPAWRLEIQPKAATAAVDPGQCGRVSVFFTPPQARDLYPAYVNSIDGKGVLRTIDSFELSPGRHTIALHELITDYRLSHRGMGMENAKLLTIDVEPNKVYYMAAKFLPENRFKTYKSQFWEPVMWRVADKACP